MTGLIWGSLAVVLGAFCLLAAVIVTCMSVLVIVQFFSSVKKHLIRRRRTAVILTGIEQMFTLAVTARGAKFCS